MRFMNPQLIHLGLSHLSRRPVLSAIMVYSAGIGATFLMAAVILFWQVPVRCPGAQNPGRPYVAQLPADSTSPDARSEPIYLGVSI